MKIFMHRMRILTVVFFVFLLSSVFFIGNPTLVATSLLLSTLLVAVGLFHLLSELKTKYVGKIKIEEVAYIRHFVFRAYTKSKNIWIVYDRRLRAFRAADFREMPIEAGMTSLIGLAFLYVSYLIISTLDQAPELFFIRSSVLVIFLVLGLYNFLVSMAKFYSISNKKSLELCKKLNRNSQLKGMIEKDRLSFEITPNFLLWNGFATSIEFISQSRFYSKPIERHIVEIAREVGKIR
jgi:hypothetical protein